MGKGKRMKRVGKRRRSSSDTLDGGNEGGELFFGMDKFVKISSENMDPLFDMCGRG